MEIHFIMEFIWHILTIKRCIILVTYQEVHFSTRALIWVHPKVVSKLSQSFSLNVHIETTYDIINSFNCVVRQLFLKMFITLLSKLTKMFVSINFLVLSK